MSKLLYILGWSLVILVCAGLSTWVSFSLMEWLGGGDTGGALFAVLLAMPITLALFALCIAALRLLRRSRPPA